MDSIEIIKSPGVGIVLFLYGHVMLLGLAYTAGTYQVPYPSPLAVLTGCSVTCILVHRRIAGWLQLYSLADFLLSCGHRSFSINLATLRLPAITTEIRHRYCLTLVSLRMAYIFHGSSNF